MHNIPHSKKTKKVLKKITIKRYKNGEVFGFQKNNKFGQKFKKGNKSNGMRGKKHSLKTRKKMSNSKTGSKVASHFLYKWSRFGEKNPAWKGGITPLVIFLRRCLKYRQWRFEVFKRDNFRCIFCGKQNGFGKTIPLEADHFPKKFSVILQENKIISKEDAFICKELWDINNGRTLCRPCHISCK